MKKEKTNKSKQWIEAKQLLSQIKFQTTEDEMNCLEILESLLLNMQGVLSKDAEFIEFHSEFDRVALPLMKYMATKHDTYSICVVSANTAHIYKDSEVITTDVFLDNKDNYINYSENLINSKL